MEAIDEINTAIKYRPKHSFETATDDAGGPVTPAKCVTEHRAASAAS
ncbi:hypothetical protein ACFFIO_00200 [Citricoccus parietis]|uniref:Uncharacterized protein n=1 Tax=Citricoccus parietis TaxID=592307 RepID=A0ABV6F085_9MICC